MDSIEGARLAGRAEKITTSAGTVPPENTRRGQSLPPAPAGVLLAFRSPEAMREVEKSLGQKRSDIRYALIRPRNAAHTVPIADRLAKRSAIGQVLVYDAENLNAAARLAVLRQVNQMDLKLRQEFQQLLDGEIELSDIQDAGARMALTAEIFRLLPRIAPTTLAERVRMPSSLRGGAEGDDEAISSGANKIASVAWRRSRNDSPEGARMAQADSALRAVRLQMFHPSFGDAMRDLNVAYPEQPRAAVRTLDMILKNPLFFDELEDSRRKIQGRMVLDDYVVVDPGVDLERALGDRYEIFKAHFPDDKILRTKETSLRALYELLPGHCLEENVLFVDKDETRALKQETAGDKSLKLLAVQGAYPVYWDKVEVKILARGGSTEPIIIKGLTREGNFFLFIPIVPIDFLKHLKRYFETTAQLGRAA